VTGELWAIATLILAASALCGLGLIFASAGLRRLGVDRQTRIEWIEALAVVAAALAVVGSVLFAALR
jgi:hypothetical protein